MLPVTTHTANTSVTQITVHYSPRGIPRNRICEEDTAHEFATGTMSGGTDCKLLVPAMLDNTMPTEQRCPGLLRDGTLL